MARRVMLNDDWSEDRRVDRAEGPRVDVHGPVLLIVGANLAAERRPGHRPRKRQQLSRAPK
jgi:hypothetical protein